LSGSRPWMVPALVTASAAVSAVIASSLLGWAVAPDPDAAEAPPLLASLEAEAERSAQAAVPRRALGERVYIDGILERNLFDQSKIGVEEEGGPGGGEETVSSLNAKLKGTIVANPAVYSAAFIQVEGQQSAYAYGIGQTVQGAEILEILVDRVKIRLGGREEWLTMGDDKVLTSTNPSAEGEGGEVTQNGENEFTISRAVLDENLNDLESLSRMGRALLHRGPDGQFDGYRLSAIRRGSLPDQLGIRNGDIVHKVNGMDLNSVQGAMQALQTMQNQSSFKFEVTRRGQPVTLSYAVE
jgi:general secretion pathway protein C